MWLHRYFSSYHCALSVFHTCPILSLWISSASSKEQCPMVNIWIGFRQSYFRLCYWAKWDLVFLQELVGCCSISKDRQVRDRRTLGRDWYTRVSPLVYLWRLSLPWPCASLVVTVRDYVYRWARSLSFDKGSCLVIFWTPANYSVPFVYMNFIVNFIEVSRLRWVRDRQVCLYIKWAASWMYIRGTKVLIVCRDVLRPSGLTCKYCNSDRFDVN